MRHIAIALLLALQSVVALRVGPAAVSRRSALIGVATCKQTALKRI